MKRTLLATVVILILSVPLIPFSNSYANSSETAKELVPIFEGKMSQSEIQRSKKEKDYKLHTPAGSFDPVTEPQPILPENPAECHQ